MLNWYALNSKPHCERIVLDALAARGIEGYLPLWQPARAGRRGSGERPFFPSYLFAHVDLDAVGISALQYVPGVRRLVYCGEIPAPVPPAAIERIRARLAGMERAVTDAEGQILTAGDRVLITGGVLAGLEAVFDGQLSSDERVRLLINFIRKNTRIQIDRQHVRKLVPGPFDRVR